MLGSNLTGVRGIAGTPVKKQPIFAKNGGAEWAFIRKITVVEQFVLRFALAQSRRRGRRRWNRPRAVESNSTEKGSTDECLNSFGSVQRDGRSAKPAHKTVRVDTGAHRKR